MKISRHVLRAAVGATVATLVLTGCRGSDSGDSASAGVTDKACPEAVNKDNGCIYLGVISDLTKGPFAPLAVPITDAQKAFWKKVNEDGGVDGYDIDITSNIADAEYNPEIHNRKYQEMRKEILALGQTLGSTQTLAILEDMKTDKVLGVPASWNSAWEFEDQILESGANYCFEAMNGVDWAVANRGAKTKVVAVGYPGDYGGDAAAGVEAAAKANNLAFKKLETPPGQDNQAGAIGAILKGSSGPRVRVHRSCRDGNDHRRSRTAGLQGHRRRLQPDVEPGTAEVAGCTRAEGALLPGRSVGTVRNRHAGSQGHA